MEEWLCKKNRRISGLKPVIDPDKTSLLGIPLYYCVDHNLDIDHNLDNKIRLVQTNTEADRVCRPFVTLLYCIRFHGTIQW